MSLAGGTGSGVGTYVTEMLRDLYPKTFIMNEVIAPYQSGEVIVQSYNALLTLAHLHQVRISLNLWKLVILAFKFSNYALVISR